MRRPADRLAKMIADSSYTLPSYPNEGLVARGNLNLRQRPVVRNPDGSISTVKSISVGTDRGETLIPQVVGNSVLPQDQAIQHYQQTGENLGTFNSIAAANAYAKLLHDQQAMAYGQPPADLLAALRRRP